MSYILPNFFLYDLCLISKFLCNERKVTKKIRVIRYLYKKDGLSTQEVGAYLTFNMLDWVNILNSLLTQGWEVQVKKPA